ncbi:MAG: LamG domain-containing protein [Methylobacter sp.]
MAGDPLYNKVSLLLHCTGQNNSTTFVDSSFRPKTLTTVGDAKIITSQLDPFNSSGGVASFDGSGDYLTTPVSTEFQFGSGDFCIEGFVNPSVVSGGPYSLFWYGNASNTNDALLIWITSGSIQGIIGSGSALYGASASIAQGVWSHFAFVRYGNSLLMYVNGVSPASSNVTGVSIGVPATSPCVRIGCIYSTPLYYFSGKLAQFRIIKGGTPYTADFTPPSGPFVDFQSQVSGTISEALAANTFFARAYDITSGSLLGEKKVVDTSSFSIDIKSPEKTCYVTVSADYEVWQPGVVYAQDVNVFPLDPVSTPYYYKRINAGTSGVSEPTWPTIAGGQCNDGSVINAWELVERLIQPITHGPLILS